MEIQLQELLDTIKTRGVQKAEEEAEVILGRAREDAAAILAEARREAEAILTKVREETARREEAGRQALKLAGRDLILLLIEQIKHLFETIIQRHVEIGMDVDIVETSIIHLIKNWNETTTAEIILLLDEQHLTQLSSSFYAALAEEIRNGMEIRPISGINAGFRISQKDGALYYDFTAETIAGLLSTLLNPELAKLLKEAAQKDLE